MRSSPRLFNPAAEDFRVELLNIIDVYIEKNKNRIFKRTGVERAKSLQKLISRMVVEDLTNQQVMWRLLSYARMDYGFGPLDTSTDLRRDLLGFMAAYLKVDRALVDASYSAMFMTDLKVMQRCAEMGVWYPIDSDNLVAKARAIHIEKKLNEVQVFNPSPSVEVKDRLLAAIDQYKTAANDGWFNRWFKKEGRERADKLKTFISEQLVGKELLDERQLCARLLELARMPVGVGQGIFDTSKDLRHAVLVCMSHYLGLDENVLAQEISEASKPVFVPNNLGPIGHIPDVKMVSVEARIRHIQKALYAGELPRAEHAVTLN